MKVLLEEVTNVEVADVSIPGTKYLTARDLSNN
jgi:hypothetical protein